MEINSRAHFFSARPPKLEDAGLEDSALPAHALQEAFKRAAGAIQTTSQHLQDSVTSAIGSVGTWEEEGSKNSGPNGFWEDSCTNSGGLAVSGEKQSCVDTKTGGLIVEGHDQVVVGQQVGSIENDSILFGEDDGPKLGDTGCVEGLAGDRGQKKDKKKSTKDGPILILA